MLIPTPIDQSYSKLILTIESCNTKEQLESASRMVKNFKKLYGKVGYMKLLNYKLIKEYNNKKNSLWK